jgi:DNA-binding CsgD family transcriptional regulator
MADELNVWDSLVSTIRADPELLIRLLTHSDFTPRLQGLVLDCNDFDLARGVGLIIGRRPRQGRIPLSRRELEVYELMKQGLKNREIARTLFISEATVKVHIRHIFEKTGSRTRTEAVMRLTDDLTGDCD